MSNRYLMCAFFTFVVSLFLCTLLSSKAIAVILLIALLSLLPALLIRYPFKRYLVSSLIFAIFAFSYYNWTDHQLMSVQQNLINSEVEISGEIADVGNNAAGNFSCYKVRVLEIDGQTVDAFPKAYVNVYLDDEKISKPGTLIKGTVSFFESPVKFGAGREDGILLSSFSERDSLSYIDPIKKSLTFKLYELRENIRNKLAYGKENTKGLLRSVCFGDKSFLDVELKLSLRRIGLSHVTAVSGLHLSFLMLLFNFLLTSLGLHYRVRYLLDIFICLIFTAFVGFPPSCVRACIMLVLMCIAMATNLFEDSLTSLALASFIIPLLNPYTIRDLGYLLSVTATLGIITLRLPIENFLFLKKIGNNFRINWIYRKFTGLFACSVAATLATLPIMIIVFGSVSLIGPFANILLIYPLQFIFMAGILMVMLGWIPGIGVVLGLICDGLYVIVDKAAGLLGRLPFASTTTFSFRGLLFLGLFLAVIAAGFYCFFVKERRCTLSLLALFLCFSISFSSIHNFIVSDDNIEIAFIDVGQGDCTVISRGNSAVIFDFGGSSQKRYNLIKYFKKKNIFDVELLALTHLHSDHTNGIHTLLDNAYIDEILYPGSETDGIELLSSINSEKQTEIDNSFERTVLGDVRVSVIADGFIDENIQSENERCVCYRVVFGKTSVLITGDLSGKAELLLKERIEDTTILKVSHHGSATSSLYPFIKAVAPEISVISVGENPYGLPKNSVIERLETISSVIYQTKKEGTIRFRTDGKTMERILK